MNLVTLKLNGLYDFSYYIVTLNKKQIETIVQIATLLKNTEAIEPIRFNPQNISKYQYTTAECEKEQTNHLNGQDSTIPKQVVCEKVNLEITSQKITICNYNKIHNDNKEETDNYTVGYNISDLIALYNNLYGTVELSLTIEENNHNDQVPKCSLFLTKSHIETIRRFSNIVSTEAELQSLEYHEIPIEFYKITSNDNFELLKTYKEYIIIDAEEFIVYGIYELYGEDMWYESIPYNISDLPTDLSTL